MPGAERLRDSAALMQILDEQINLGKLWSAICASPAVVFEGKGWLKGKKATAHPAFSDKLADQRYAANSGAPTIGIICMLNREAFENHEYITCSIVLMLV